MISPTAVPARPGSRGHRVRQAMLLVLLGAMLGAFAGVNGIGIGLERTLAGWSAALRSHPASGTLHVVEIDARSIAAIERWPWPREEHARIVDRLSQAGATAIAFDVDFSSRSTVAGDAAFAAAIDRADGRVILPTLRQEAGGNAAGWIDSLPAPALRDRAALASVSVRPDADGNVREVPIGFVTAGVPRPSLSAMLAGRGGVAGDPFPVDYAIDPASIPRHSFIDIRDGRFNPASIRGKQVVIGATAVELGDRYPVPNYGVIPGVVIQALAAETLAGGVPIRIGWPVAFLMAVLLGLAVVLQRGQWRFAAGLVAAPLLIFVGAVGVQAATGNVLTLAPAVIALAVILLGGLAGRGLAAVRQRRLHDPVTGMPNGAALGEALLRRPGAEIVVARLSDYEKLAAGLSAAAVGQLLLRVADRIALAGADTEVHRINDDMLAWIAIDDNEREDRRYEGLRALMQSPVEVGGRRIDVSLAIGVAHATGRDADRAIAQAALAAEQAYADGTGWHQHSEDENEAVDRDLSLLSELTDAVANGELQVLYQPKLDIARGVIASVEALVRWNHPTRGFLRPDLFIPLAERNDRIAGLTLFVIERTIADLATWSAAGHALTAAVNLSAKLLTSASFNADLLALIDRTGVDPNRLIFEVTESAAMTDPEGSRAALAKFRAMGIAISMDDYGTGQSTLSYLRQLPLNELKIDRSFVQYAHQNRSDAILVRSTIDLAHELGLKVVAEGVEDAECLAFLASVHCDLAQGYWISRPVPADQVVASFPADRAVAA